MKSIGLSIIFILLSGCAATPTGNIEAFGNAAKGVTEKINNVINEFNSAKVNNELTKIAQHKRPITISKLDPIKKVIIGDVDKKKYALYKANKAIGAYADALSGLAKSGSENEIDLAASKLYSSFHNFNEQYKVLAETDDILIKGKTSARIGSIIAAIGGAYADKKRGEAIKSIVIKSDPYIQSIGDVIIKEFLKGVIEERLYTIKHTELSGYIKDYNAKVTKSLFSAKKKSLNKIYEKYIEMQSSSASITQAIKAIKEIKRTHKILKNEVEKDRFSSKELVASIGRLKDIESHYDDLEAMMLSCETEIVADDKKGIICKKSN